jgi:hypothetical protein
MRQPAFVVSATLPSLTTILRSPSRSFDDVCGQSLLPKIDLLPRNIAGRAKAPKSKMGHAGQ